MKISQLASSNCNSSSFGVVLEFHLVRCCEISFFTWNQPLWWWSLKDIWGHLLLGWGFVFWKGWIRLIPWSQGREAKVKSIKSEHSFFILLFAFQVHNVHGAFNALEGADKLSSNRGYSWGLQLSATLCRRESRAFHATLVYPEGFNLPLQPKWSRHCWLTFPFPSVLQKRLSPKGPFAVLMEFFIHILFL